MTQKKKLSLAFLLLILLGIFKVQGQDRTELEKRRFQIIEQIDNTNKLLDEMESNKKVMLSDLKIIENQIQNRKQLLSDIEQEIAYLDDDIKNAEIQNDSARITLDSLKSQYNLVLRAVYRQKALHNPVLDLLSTKSVSMALLKSNYYKRLQEYVGVKLDNLNIVQSELEQKIILLTADRKAKEEALVQLENQSRQLDNEQDRRKVMMASLIADEASLKITLSEQRKDRENLNVAIEKVIFSAFKSGEAETSVPSSNFASLKGKLRWPVQGGVVTSKFGKQRHPTVKNLTISNNGIDVRAPQNAEVKAVFNGKVVSVAEMQGFGTTVIINHGTYYSVYSRLGATTLVKDQKVSKGETIGRLAVRDGSSTLHFEVWKNNVKQNPINWLEKLK